MRSTPDGKGRWFHAYFTDKPQAEHHRQCQRGRGRIAKMRKNGAGWEVFWREKLRQPKREG